MRVADNYALLKAKHPYFASKIGFIGESGQVQVVDSKSGDSTLVVERSGTAEYLHSKYNPLHEAGKFMEQHLQDAHNHVLFYGVGLGYHIDIFARHNPTIPFSIYEPDVDVFRAFLSHQDMKRWSMLRHIYVELDVSECSSYVQDFVNQTSGQATIITLPSYERVYAEAFRRFSETMQHFLQETRKIFQLRHAFEKKWIINALDNFPFTIHAEHICNKKQLFEGKPVIIVAAGPSLVEEIENLKYIKAQKSAYIFAVGSAITSLLHHGIIPDGACTYDPHFHNVNVFKKVIDEEITCIPLIYGSTVGAGTLKDYPGPLVSLFTDKDPIVGMLLKKENEKTFEQLEDAPSIAIIALQLFSEMHCNPIVLVGQNLGYRNNSYYASGLENTRVLVQSDLDASFQVEDVSGNMIQTDWSFNTMRLEMEFHLTKYTDRTVINTTQGGAKIQGTQFMDLSDVMKVYLNDEVVDSNWYVNEGLGYDLNYLREQSKFLEEKRELFVKQIDEVIGIFNDMNRSVNQKNAKKAFKLTQKFDTAFESFQKNEFYKTILKPMNMLQLEWLTKQFDTIKYESDMLVKTKKVVEKVGKFVYDIRNDLQMITPLYMNMQKAVQIALNQEKPMNN
ncbi:DUF115 domain-containing protein [Paenibacillus sp. LMG 31461]|uniref:DUF115 domain-containing protein n=1 Tax=Paenibacillus plantarum TaxID=2654975 RepID=A0ABX1XE86_9BACL|nr:6-hydroxymethylpterin diphosphokinase MptE-like protein [Paenibacillus plantarum]NOU66749.1 DUF115 domain-containing protein [Paenibacillus plantarum]